MSNGLSTGIYKMQALRLPMMGNPERDSETGEFAVKYLGRIF